MTYFIIVLYIIGNITIQGTKLGNLTTTVSNLLSFHVDITHLDNVTEREKQPVFERWGL